MLRLINNLEIFPTNTLLLLLLLLVLLFLFLLLLHGVVREEEGQGCIVMAWRVRKTMEGQGRRREGGTFFGGHWRSRIGKGTGVNEAGGRRRRRRKRKRKKEEEEEGRMSGRH